MYFSYFANFISHSFKKSQRKCHEIWNLDLARHPIDLFSNRKMLVKVYIEEIKCVIYIAKKIWIPNNFRFWKRFLIIKSSRNTCCVYWTTSFWFASYKFLIFMIFLIFIIFYILIFCINFESIFHFMALMKVPFVAETFAFPFYVFLYLTLIIFEWRKWEETDPLSKKQEINKNSVNFGSI